jgi:hypothetical protein
MLPNAQLTELNLAFGVFENNGNMREGVDNNANWKSFARFLSSQTRLTKLTLSSVLPLVIPDEVTFKPLKCQILNLTLSGIFQGSDKKKEELIKVLAPSVTHLEFKNAVVTMELMQNILRNFKSLEYLLLDYVRVLDGEESNQKIDTNVKTLIVKTMNFNYKSFVEFFSMFKSTNFLDLSEFISVDFHNNDRNKFKFSTFRISLQDVKTVSSNMHNVTLLTFSGPIRIFRHASFENLETLKWGHFDETKDINWTEFIMNNPKLTTIYLEVTNDRLDCEALMKSARDNMRFIIFGEFEVTKERLRLFMTKDVKLQIDKSALMMTDQEFDDIVGDRKTSVKFSAATPQGEPIDRSYYTVKFEGLTLGFSSNHELLFTGLDHYTV